MCKTTIIVPDILLKMYIVPDINICYNILAVEKSAVGDNENYVTLIYWNGGGCSALYTDLGGETFTKDVRGCRLWILI